MVRDLQDKQDLLSRLKDKDWEAFKELIENYQDTVYRIAFGMTNDPMDAQDITQEVFLTIYRKIEDFEGRSSLSTWIYRIAVNTSIDLIRKRSTRKEEVSLEEYLPQFSEDERLSSPMVDWSRLPLKVLMNEESMEVIKESIRALSPDIRIAVVLKDIEGLSLREVAEILNLTVPAVKSRIHRGRLILRGWLADYFERLRPRLKDRKGSQ